MINDIYKTVLKDRRYEVVSAYNKQSALKYIDDHRPDLILLDLMIPIGPGEELITYDHPVGFDILEWLHHHKVYSKIPVVILTNLDSDMHKEHAEKLGAREYLVKANLEPHDVVRYVDALAPSQ